MKFALSGASGMIGSALRRSLENDQHEVIPLVRSNSGNGIPWNPEKQTIDLASLEGVDGIIHLAGENIAGARWTDAFKEKVYLSRSQGTSTLSRAIKRMDRPPSLFVSASATGYFGDRGDERLTEDSPPGIGFLPTVCRAWEDAARPAALETRLIVTRFGMVLAREGGALAKMLLPFRLGLGGVVGSGQQYMSWISLTDAVSAIRHLIDHDHAEGTFHLVSPSPVTNREFTKTLGNVLHRPTLFPLPAGIARLLMGEMADGLLLSSARVLPSRLLEAGFRFKHPDLRSALVSILDPNRPSRTGSVADDSRGEKGREH
ncbi:TIGR01777 family oxidoreductase [bacterium]|nr:TIGR01777 family oxidoreductase [bacterium]